MKEHLSAAVRSFIAALSLAALSALLLALMLSLYDIERSMLLAVPVWIALLAAQSAANECLVSRGSTMLAFAAVNGLLYIFGVRALVAHTVFIPGSQGFPVFLAVLACGVGLFGMWAAQHTPGSNLFVRFADALIAAIALYMGCAFGLGKAFLFPVLAFALGALALDVALAASLRAGGESDSVVRGSGAGGLIVLGAMLMLCLAAAGGLLSLADGHIDSLVHLLSLLWQAFCRFLLAAVTVFARILAFLSPKPKMERAIYAADDYALPVSGGIAPIEGPAWLPYVFLGALAVGALLLIAALIRMLHGTKLSRTRAVRRRRKVTRTSHFFSALRALLLTLAERIRFEFLWRTHRHTPEGLLILAQRTGRLHRLPRRKSESGGAYLRRVHAALLAHSLPSSLDRLADTLDAVLYGGASVRLSPEDAAEYERQILRLASLPKEKGGAAA